MGGAGGMGGGAPIVEPQGTSIFVEVGDKDGNPLPSVVAVTTPDGTMRTTDGAGRILFENLTAGSFVGRIEAPGYAPASIVAGLEDGVHAGSVRRLIPRGAKQSFDDQNPAILNAAGVRVNITPDSLMFEDGTDVTGMVDAYVTTIDPNVDRALLPGPLEGVRLDESQVSLEPLSMVEVSLFQGDVPVQLKPDKPATMELVVPDALAANVIMGQPFRGYSFDLDAGVWHEEAFGTIQTSTIDATKLAWIGSVPHFTWWTDAADYTDKNCFQVTLKDAAGVAWSGQPINPIPIDFQGTPTVTYTGIGGQACVNLKYLASANLKAGADTSNPLGAANATGTGNPSACGLAGAMCQPITIQSSQAPICTPGARQDCVYSGDATKLGKGICVAGAKMCNALGTAWSACAGEVLPASAETCATIWDDDCNGKANDTGTSCTCTPGAMQAAACYRGLPATKDVGICKAGNTTCNAAGTGYTCKGDVIPLKENCGTIADDDCNGSSECSWWSKRSGDAKTQEGLAIATYSNTSYITGSFQGSMTLGAVTLTNPDAATSDTFVAKLDTNGNVVWAKSFGNANNSRGMAIATNTMGNVYVAGRCNGNVDFGDGVKTLAGDGVFLVKLDSAGNALWSKRFPTTAPITSVSISSFDPGGVEHVALAAAFSGTFDYGAGMFTSAGLDDVAIMRFDGTGLFGWAKQNGDAMNQRLAGIGYASSTNVVIVAGAIEGMGGMGVFAAQYAVLDGMSPANYTAYMGAPTLLANAMAVVPGTDDVIIGGAFTGNAMVGISNILAGGGNDGFLVKLSAGNMNPTGLQLFQSAGNESVKSLAVDAASGTLATTGSFEGTVTFAGSTPLTAIGTDTFIAKLNLPNLTVVSGRSLGNSATDVRVGWQENSPNALWLFGSTTSAGIEFGNGPLLGTGTGDSDIAIAKLSY